MCASGPPGSGSSHVTKERHQLIAKITRELEQVKFNTCVSGFMEFINEAYKTEETDWMGDFVLLLAPFAPHIAEELWQNVLKQEGSVFTQSWPTFDAKKLVADSVKLVVQEGGKLRGTLTVPAGSSEEEVRVLIGGDEKLAEVMARSSKAIYIEDKVINFV